MTVFLKLYTLTLTGFLTCFTAYLVMISPRYNITTGSGMPLAILIPYEIGYWVDQVLFNGGKRPKKEIFANARETAEGYIEDFPGNV